MPTGKPGSSLTQELNRLAGITDVAQYLDAQGAANLWAQTTSSKGIIGALNFLAESSRTPDQFKDLDGVCNEIAQTTGLAAPAALRSIDA